MSVDFLLKLDGIKGEAQDHKYVNQIDVLAWSWGVTQSSSGSGSGSGAGKVKVRDITFTKFTDAATAALVLHCCNGKHINKGSLIARKAGDKPLEYLKISLEDILVTSADLGVGIDHKGRSVETITLNFKKFKIEYFKQKPDGSGAPSGEMAWDIGANAPA